MSDRYLFRKKVYGSHPDLAEIALLSVVNDLKIKEVQMPVLFGRISLSEGISKKIGYDMEKTLKKAGKGKNLSFREVSIVTDPALKWPCLEVLGTGQGIDCGNSSFVKKEGVDIVLTKWIGLEGTALLLKEKERELKNRFSLSFLDSAKRRMSAMDATDDIERLQLLQPELGHEIVCQISDGGIFASLWELANHYHLGFAIDLKSIPILQETIELCECFRLNPYQLASTGSLLILSKDGETLVEELAELDIASTVIGRTTDNNDKIICNGEEQRYLDRPVPDEVFKLFG